MDHAAQDVTGLGLECKARDLDVLEAVKGKTRLPNLLPLTLENIHIRRLGTTQVFRVQGPIRIEAFTVTQCHCCAGLALYFHSAGGGF